LREAPWAGEGGGGVHLGEYRTTCGGQEAAPGRPTLSRRHWIALVRAFAGLHYGALLASVWIGSFDPDPNQDHVPGMVRQGRTLRFGAG
jgi:hypothetical protein